MIKKPVTIILCLTLLVGWLFTGAAFSQETVIPEPPPMPKSSPIPEPPYLPDEYTILCVAEEATGLYWSKGKWTSTKFILKKRHLVKSEKNECFLPNIFPEIDLPRRKRENVCLNIRILGKPYLPMLSGWCTKESIWFSSKGIWNTEISCNNQLEVLPMGYSNFYLKPNGWYHLTWIHSNLSDKPKVNYKDGMFVEVGKCSMVAP